MADEGGEVQIRLSQEGGDDVLAALAGISAQLEKLLETSEKAGKGVDGVSEQLEKLGETAHSALGAALITAGNQAVELFQKIANAIRGPIEEGIHFNAELEQTQVKIAGLISVYNTVPEGVDKWAASLRGAEEAHELLTAAAFRSGSAMESMERGFEKLYGVAITSGAKSVEEVVNLETSVANFARVMGTSVEAASSQVARAMQGMSSNRTEFGKLLSSLGIDRETLLSWKAQGESVEKVMDLLKDFNALGAKMQTTWQGVTTNMKNAWEVFLREASGPLFESLKTSLGGLLGGAIDLDTGRLTGPVAEYAKALGEGLAEVARAVMPLISSLVQLGAVAVKTFVEFVTMLGPVVPALKLVIDAVALLVDKLGVFGLTALSAVAAFTQLSKVLAVTEGAGFMPTIARFLTGLGDIPVAADGVAASVIGMAEKMTGTVVPAAGAASKAVEGLSLAANAAQATGKQLAFTWAGVAAAFGAPLVAIGALIAAVGLLVLKWKELDEQAAASKATIDTAEPTKHLLDRLRQDADFLPPKMREEIGVTDEQLKEAEAKYAKLKAAGIEAAKGIDTAWKALGGSEEVKRLTTLIEDLTLKLNKLAIDAAKYKPTADQLDSREEAEKRAAVFRAQQAEAAAQAKALAEILGGEAAQEVQIRADAAAKIAAINRKITGPDATVTEAKQPKEYQALSNEIVAIEQLKDAKLRKLNEDYLATVRKDSLDMANAYAAAVRAGMTGLGAEIQAAEDSHASTVEAARDRMLKAEAVYGEARKKLSKATEEEREKVERTWAEAQRVFHGAEEAATLEQSNKLIAIRRRYDDEMEKSLGGLRVEALRLQGDTYEAELRGIFDKLLADEKAFATQFADTIPKLQLAENVYGPNIPGSAPDLVNDLTNALTKLRSATAETAPKIVEDILKIAEALRAATTDPEAIRKLDDMIERLRRIGSNAKAQADNAVLEQKTKLDVLRGDWDAYFNDLIEKQRQAAVNHTLLLEDIQNIQKQVADKAYANAITVPQGIEAGFRQIFTTVKSAGQDMADFLKGIWSSMTSAFDTIFYDALSGKLDDIKNVFKSLWDDILKGFAKVMEQMLVRWLITGDAIGSGQGTGGILGKLLGGSEAGGSAGGFDLAKLLGQDKRPSGSAGDPIHTWVENQTGTTGAVNTLGGTSVFSPVTTEGEGGSQWTGWNTGVDQYQTSPNASWAGGSSGLGTAAKLGAYAAYAYGAYQGISSIFTPHETSRPTYQGQDLGQTADFGGPGGGQAAAAAATVAAVALTATIAAAGAAASATALVAAATASAVPLVGWIVAAALLVVALIMSIFSGPQEGHVNVAIKDAFDKSGAQSVIGHFVEEIVDSTANFVGSLAMRAGAGPDAVKKYVAAYNTAFKAALGTATFDIAAGDKDDLQKDVEAFFNTVLPKMAMQTAFGQWGTGMPAGDRDWQGGFAGLDWNSNNAKMDAAGNFINKQLYDPGAPIPLLLSGIGFTADAIGEIATKLSTATDMKAFKQWLMDLVGVVYDFGELGKAFGRSWSDWQTEIKKIQSEKGTAAEFSKPIENLLASGSLLELTFGDERVAAAKQLVADSQTLLNNMGQALASILSLIDSINKTTSDTITSYQNKLKTSAEIERDSRAAYITDVAKIATAANPQEVQERWQQVMRDLTTTLDAIVARINAIKDLQKQYADFREQMTKDAGPQFATNPFEWLTKNALDIADVSQTLAKATGDDVVTNAQKLLDLTKERYQNEMTMLNQIRGMIQSITDQNKQTTDNLRMQAMGHVETDAQGNKKWVADTHAQGEYLMARYNDLIDKLGKATTPEEVQRLYGQIQSVISQLASQPQDPSHYAESRQFLIGASDKATQIATDLLKKWGKTLEDDLSGIGGKLKAGETALADALKAAQKDFTDTLDLMTEASTQATAALSNMALKLTTAMQQVAAVISHWTFVMTNKEGAIDPNWDYEKNQPKGTGYTPPAAQDVWITDPSDPSKQICIQGPSMGQTRANPAYHAPGTAGGGGGHGPGDQRQEPGPAPSPVIAPPATVTAAAPTIPTAAFATTPPTPTPTSAALSGEPRLAEAVVVVADAGAKLVEAVRALAVAAVPEAAPGAPPPAGLTTAPSDLAERQREKQLAALAELTATAGDDTARRQREKQLAALHAIATPDYEAERQREEQLDELNAARLVAAASAETAEQQRKKHLEALKAATPSASTPPPPVAVTPAPPPAAAVTPPPAPAASAGPTATTPPASPPPSAPPPPPDTEWQRQIKTIAEALLEKLGTRSPNASTPEEQLRERMIEVHKAALAAPPPATVTPTAAPPAAPPPSTAPAHVAGPPPATTPAPVHVATPPPGGGVAPAPSVVVPPPAPPPASTTPTHVATPPPAPSATPAHVAAPPPPGGTTVPPPPPASPPDTEWQRQVKAIAEALFEKISAQHGAPETPGTVPPPAPAPGHASPAPPPPASTVSGAPDWKKFGEEITPPPTTSPEEKPASEEDMRKAMAELAAKLTAARAVDVNVEVHSGSPEEIATAVADTTRAAVYDDTLKAIRANNVELVRVIRNNPILTKAPSTGSAR